MVARRRQNCRQVGYVQQRVRRRLEPEQTGMLCSLEAAARVLKRQPDIRPATTFLPSSSQADDGLVAIVRQHDLGTGGQQVEDRYAGGQAGGDRDGDVVLEDAQDFLERLPRGRPVVAGIGAVADEEEVDASAGATFSGLPGVYAAAGESRPRI